MSLLVCGINPSAYESNNVITPRRINVSIKDICEALDIPRPTVVRAIKRLQENGQIQRIHTGYYQVNVYDSGT